MRFGPSVFLMLIAAGTVQAGEHVLEIRAAAANASVTPRDVRRNTLRLPALEYVFTVTARCADSFRPVSLSLTVADSRRAVDADALAETGSSTQLRLTVPARQLAPVPVTGFCAPGGDAGSEDQTRELLLRATLSAGASLTCAADGSREITYASAPLDVLVSCDLPEEARESD